ncbi:MAG: hypothetical protein AB9907_05175 [Flexilinea sp.]
MRNKFYQFMQGRYGNDQLNNGLLILGSLLVVISAITRWEVLLFIGYISLGLSIFRSFSKDFGRRSRENYTFLRYWNQIVSFYFKKKRQILEWKNYKFYHCPQCQQMIRVPRGKGKICITCPKCRVEFTKRT